MLCESVFVVAMENKTHALRGDGKACVNLLTKLTIDRAETKAYIGFCNISELVEKQEES